MSVKTLELEKATFLFNPDDSYTNEKSGQVYTYVSIKKVTKFKDKEKYQTLTIKHEDFSEFRDWLLKCLEELDAGGGLAAPDDKDIPF